MSELTFATLTFNANHTPVSAQFDDIYFSTEDGLAESHYVFQEGNQLWERWLTHPRTHFVIAETGFGTGLNFFAVLAKFREFRTAYPTHPLKRLYFISFEKYPLNAAQLAEIHQIYPQFRDFSAQLCRHWQPRQSGCQRYHFGESYLDIWFGDMTDNLPQLGDLHNAGVDAWFLDGFAPDKNPEMWNDALYRQMFRLTRNGGSFATFTAASAVRRGLQAVGFDVKKRKGFGKKREMLYGNKPECTAATLQFPYYAQAPSQAEHFALFGGGIASLFTALSLLERGKKVTLYCADNALALNASGNKQGAIYPQLSDDDARNVRFYLHAFDYARQRLASLAEKVDFEWQNCGVALYGYNDKTAQKLQKLVAQNAGKQIIHACDADTLSAHIGLRVAHGGAFIPEGGWLAPQQLVQNGFAYLQRLGLQVVLNHRAENFRRDADGWHGWQWTANGETFHAQAVILATGHTLREVSQCADIPFYPVRGLVSEVPTNTELSRLKCVLCYDGYLTPQARSGSHCVGASHIRDNQTCDFKLDEHLANGEKLQQNLHHAPWTQLDLSANRAKVGIRCALRDRMPLLGQVPDFAAQQTAYADLYNRLRRRQAVENAENFTDFYLLGALGSRGLTTAPLLGELLASMICAEPLPLSETIWHNLLPNRAWIRRMLKGK